MAAEMEKRHANLYHTVSRERFQAAVEDLCARIPMLQRNEVASHDNPIGYKKFAPLYLNMPDILQALKCRRGAPPRS